MLTDAEIETYRRNGYVVPAGFRLDDNEIETLQSAVAQVLSDNPDAEPDRIINPHLDRGRPYRLRGSRAFHAIVHDGRILDMAEAVMGPDLVLLFTHLFCKTPRSRRVVPWHQDGPFWPVEPMASCTVWLALDKVDAGNGAMRVIPGSHRQPYRRHELVDDPDSTLNREIPRPDIDESAAHTIELEPGQVSVHDIGIVHGSAANTSGRRRAGFAMRYMPATSCVHRRIENAAADWGTCRWNWCAAGTGTRAPTFRWAISASPGRRGEARRRRPANGARHIRSIATESGKAGCG